MLFIEINLKLTPMRQKVGVQFFSKFSRSSETGAKAETAKFR